MSDEMLDGDISYSDADATNYQQQDLLYTIAQLEQRLQNAQTCIDSYQNERSELLGTIIQLKLRLQNVVDILEK